MGSAHQFSIDDGDDIQRVVDDAWGFTIQHFRGIFDCSANQVTTEADRAAENGLVRGRVQHCSPFGSDHAHAKDRDFVQVFDHADARPLANSSMMAWEAPMPPSPAYARTSLTFGIGGQDILHGGLTGLEHLSLDGLDNFHFR